MKSKLLKEGPQKVYALVFETGDEVVEGLSRFASEKHLSASHFTGLGALRDVEVGFFDFGRKDYDRTLIDEQVEVVSLVGDVALNGTEPQVHPHIVVAKRDGTAYGGHLMKAHVKPTLEVIITETPAHLCKSNVKRCL